MHLGHTPNFSKDDIPLVNIDFRKKYILEQLDDSDKDETFKPSTRDNKSIDTEYSSHLSDTEKQDLTIKKALLKYFKAANTKAKQKINIHQTNTSAKQNQTANEVIKSKQDNYQQHNMLYMYQIWQPQRCMTR